MGEQRERQRIKSRVDEFPDEIRAQMDGMLADVNYTYQEIADTLTEQGYEISRSAVGRYAMRHNSAARRLKEAREQTTALLQQIRENQDVEHGTGVGHPDRRADAADRHGGGGL